MVPVVVMGVSGSGKSTIGAGLATRLGARFIDADDLHPMSNVKKMAAGIPLDDADRAPWLGAICDELQRGNVVVACSALKRSYRDQMRFAEPALRLLYLHADPQTLAYRMADRGPHFMPVTLLTSQLDTLELPDPDENALTADTTLPPAAIIDRAFQALSATSGRSTQDRYTPRDLDPRDR